MVNGIGNKKLAEYLFRAVSDYHSDLDTIRFVRRLHIKQVHLHRRFDRNEMVLLRMRRLI